MVKTQGAPESRMQIQGSALLTPLCSVDTGHGAFTVATRRWTMRLSLLSDELTAC